MDSANPASAENCKQLRMSVSTAVTRVISASSGDEGVHEYCEVKTVYAASWWTLADSQLLATHSFVTPIAATTMVVML